MEGAELSKSFLRKIERKQRRVQAKISDEIGAIFSETPTTKIAICNIGLVNGCTQEVIASLFLPYGTILQISMLPNQSFCFVEFQDLQSSINAYNQLHGHHQTSQNKMLLLSYSTTLPSIPQNQSSLPKGLKIYENFITPTEEIELLSLLNWKQAPSLKQRQVQHFGYEFRYDTNNVDLTQPLDQKVPEQCMDILQRINFKPNQLTVNKYEPGQGIPPHVDTHSAFEDPIVSLSLGSTTVMDFKHRSGQHCPVVLPQRSLLVMSDAARYDWTHGITSRTMDVVPISTGLTVQDRRTRVSFTFRRVLESKRCSCKYKNECDTVDNEITDNVAAELEKVHVHEVYNQIAEHFSDTRHKPWPNVLDFVLSFEVGSILLDVGCGNGKYLNQNCNVFNIGCDRSIELLTLCKEKDFEIFETDCLYLPIRTSSIDGCISIAVIHHLATEERRLQAIREMVRVLRVGGKALIYVWAKNQNLTEKSSYLKQDRKNRKGDVQSCTEEIVETGTLKLPVHLNRTQFKHKDMLVPWKTKTKGENTLLRYYHVYEEEELQNICQKETNVIINKYFYDQGNWCIILEKTK